MNAEFSSGRLYDARYHLRNQPRPPVNLTFARSITGSPISLRVTGLRPSIEETNHVKWRFRKDRFRM
jgi:hypothetical protein